MEIQEPIWSSSFLNFFFHLATPLVLALSLVPPSFSLVLHIHFSFPDFSKKRKKERRGEGERMPSIIFLSPGSLSTIQTLIPCMESCISDCKSQYAINKLDWSISDLEKSEESLNYEPALSLPCCHVVQLFLSLSLKRPSCAFQTLHGHAISVATKAERNGTVATWRHHHSAAV